MKHETNKSTIVKSVLAFLLLSATLLAGAFVVRSTSASAKANGLNKAFNKVAGAFALGQTCTQEQEPNETIATANAVSIPGSKCGTVKFGDAASFEYTYSGGQKDKI